jgi:hypothetical protein
MPQNIEMQRFELIRQWNWKKFQNLLKLIIRMRIIIHNSHIFKLFTIYLIYLNFTVFNSLE